MTQIHFFLIMDLSKRSKEASDAELPGPGSSVTDLSVSQGTLNDDQAIQMDSENIPLQILVPLVDGGTPCGVCVSRGRNIVCLDFKNLVEHLNVHHKCVEIIWACRQCNKRFPKAHGWRCHFPKCKGQPTRQPAVEAFRCELCSDSFDTRIGLSMHERHKHPRLRNRKRMELAERINKTPGRKATVWSEEEVDLLKKLDRQFRGARFPNIEIQKFFPNKTADQVRHKRADLPKLPDVSPDRIRENEPSTSDDDTEKNAAVAFGAARPCGTAGKDEDEQRWLEAVLDAVDSAAEIPAAISDLDKKLTNLWTEKRDDVLGLRTGIEKFISCLLTPFLINNSNNNNDEDTARPKQNFTKRNSKNKNKNNRNVRRRYGFARSQEIYKHCPKKLADMVFKGDYSLIDLPQRLPEAGDVERLYGELWGVEGPRVRHTQRNIMAVSMLLAMPPITASEIEDKIKRSRVKSAAGPDGLQKRNLLKPGIPAILSKLFNILLYCDYYPQYWKVNRTTLIPKVGKDPMDVKNWRPITISSLISRIWSSLIDRRIRSVLPESLRQKGFTAEDGCKQNVVLLTEAIQRCKAETGGVFSILDINKAFDTIPHSAIEASLVRKGIPSRVAGYICKMYENCSTVIKANGSQTVNISLRRGVKQGDPLSPILFNLCIEELLEQLDSATAGLPVGNNRNISVLAFADDLVLLGKSTTEAQEQINIVNRYLREMDMSLSANKCGIFQIKIGGGSWYLKNPNVYLEKDKVPNIDPDEVFTYLGAKFGPWKGLHKGIVVPDIIKIIKRVRALALKPYQKVNLITTYIVPHFIYSLLISPPSGSTLKLLDSEIRQQVKEILHLTASTANGFFYTSKNNGGLGLPRLEHVVKLAILRSGIKMRKSNDPAVREVLEHDNADHKLRTIANSLRINWPATLEDIANAKRGLKLKKARCGTS